ncbi:hypothetical protein K432DRAFT_430627 [Lepidopterella palustris CBS 459.81]|uniref:Uncharacterized protein n=1 Tax=Lepidopterella palustris CBS 459.81 TaxID=1314670 RepID=A0A8E2DXF3_9PEZI|nr:hypothetical protein K432DRAFT_430627 [Lepidopterella palustris CBS 459.81]
MAFLPLFLSCALLSALSITNLGLITSMVSFLHIQKYDVKTYQVNWPDNQLRLTVLPQHIWLDQGHTSNGVAGYGFFLGLFGMFVAWRQRDRDERRRSKSLMTLIILLILAVLFTLSAIVFVFVVTYQTNNQTIESSIATFGVKYPADHWTPETWYKSLLAQPIDDSLRGAFKMHIHTWEAWRWMLLPIFVVDVVALGLAVAEMRRQRKGAQPFDYPVEK